jgi:hypothetical protein
VEKPDADICVELSAKLKITEEDFDIELITAFFVVIPLPNSLASYYTVKVDGKAVPLQA